MKIKKLFPEFKKKEQELLPTAFDTVGDVLIFNDFPEELKKKEEKIGKRLLEKFKHINVVAKKTGKYGGTYRTPKIKILAGERRKETVHKENGVLLKLHIEKVYFSARTATERLRIIEKVKKNERVLIMFSGIGVLPIEIAKHTQAKDVVGVEINPAAHEYALENAGKNKVDVDLYCGDVRKVVPTLQGTFDRIAMPLPKDATAFLDVALRKMKKGVIHVYVFGSLEDVPNMKEAIRGKVHTAKKTCRIMHPVKCGQFSPSDFRLRFDVHVR